MNTNGLAKHYDQLNPEERFALMLQAAARGDQTEENRLMKAGRRVRVSMPDTAPFAVAFDVLALLTFIEIVDQAGFYLEAFAASDGCEFDKPTEKRWINIAYASGYVLKTRYKAWLLFCERRSVPPLLLWDDLPGFDRLQRALGLAADCAFNEKDFLGWFNARHAKDESLPSCPLTTARLADALEQMFKDQVEREGG